MLQRLVLPRLVLDRSVNLTGGYYDTPMIHGSPVARRSRKDPLEAERTVYGTDPVPETRLYSLPGSPSIGFERTHMSAADPLVTFISSLALSSSREDM